MTKEQVEARRTKGRARYWADPEKYRAKALRKLQLISADPVRRENLLAKKRAHARRCRLADPVANQVKKRQWRREWRKTPAGRAKGKEALKKPENKIRHALRHRAWLVLHGKKKMAPTMRYVGCSAEELKAHLASQFKPGMNWENHGTKGWHIDHKRPLASFAFFLPDGSINEEELRRAMHFTNLQPLWYWENASKGASIPA